MNKTNSNIREEVIKIVQHALDNPSDWAYKDRSPTQYKLVTYREDSNTGENFRCTICVPIRGLGLGSLKYRIQDFIKYHMLGIDEYDSYEVNRYGSISIEHSNAIKQNSSSQNMYTIDQMNTKELFFRKEEWSIVLSMVESYFKGQHAENVMKEFLRGIMIEKT